MIDRDPSFWRGDLTLPDPTDQADLEALLDGCAVLGTDADPWQGWHPDSVTRTADALASVLVVIVGPVCGGWTGLYVRLGVSTVKRR